MAASGRQPHEGAIQCSKHTHAADLGSAPLAILGWRGLGSGIVVHVTTTLISTPFNEHVMESSMNLSAFAWQLISTANLLTMFALALGVLATAGYFVAVAVTTPHTTAPNAAPLSSGDAASREQVAG